MSYLFKYTGIFAIGICLSFSGFLKAYFKREEIKRLKALLSSLSCIEDMLTLGNKSRREILSECFESSAINGGRFTAAWDKSGKAKSIINSFLSEFGSCDTGIELGRIERAKREMSEHISKEESEYAGLSKIWQTAGVCAGLAVGIMLA